MLVVETIAKFAALTFILANRSRIKEICRARRAVVRFKPPRDAILSLANISDLPLAGNQRNGRSGFGRPKGKRSCRFLIASFSLVERQSRTDKLKEAVAAFNEALKEYTRDRAPLYWAMTTGNQGVVLLRLANAKKMRKRPRQRFDRSTQRAKSCAPAATRRTRHFTNPARSRCERLSTAS